MTPYKAQYLINIWTILALVPELNLVKSNLQAKVGESVCQIHFRKESFFQI